MHLARCSDQQSTLDDFYRKLSVSDEAVSRQIGETMLSLLARLRALPDDRRVWGLTSHYQLVLLAADSYQTPWLVIVGVLDERNYFIEYLMPNEVAPWPG